MRRTQRDVCLEDNHVGLADIAIVKCQASVLGFRQLLHLAVILSRGACKCLCLCPCLSKLSGRQSETCNGYHAMRLRNFAISRGLVLTDVIQ